MAAIVLCYAQAEGTDTFPKWIKMVITPFPKPLSLPVFFNQSCICLTNNCETVHTERIRITFNSEGTTPCQCKKENCNYKSESIKS